MSTKVTSLKKIGDISGERWDALSQKKIYFAHQSVGFNIIEGVEGLAKSNKKIGLSIVETRDPGGFAKPVFAHSTIGQNLNPQAKYEDFMSVMKSGLGETVDTAFLKLCYVDVRKDADVQALFQLHKQTYRQLGEMFPEVQLVHHVLGMTMSSGFTNSSMMITTVARGWPS